ncbi:hypothetical protein B0H14DRAFT_2690194, partial [Mycena olivaceomarginata]
MWCVEKGHLATFWPELECEGCARYRKSHKAHLASEDAVPEECPLDASSVPKTITATRLDALRQEINRIIALSKVYEARYSIPLAEEAPTTAKKRKHFEQEDIDSDDSESTPFGLSHKELLEDALDLVLEDLPQLVPMKDGLIRWVVNAAYILIQVWAQMVRHNGTIAHLTCHNLGMIITRHRATQTLIVSKFLEYTDAPILQSTALTVYAYNDAIARYDAHEEQKKPHWLEDPFRGETKETQEAAKKARKKARK